MPLPKFFKLIKKTIKKPLNFLGLDIIRYTAPALMEGVQFESEFSIEEMKWISSYQIKTVLDIGANAGHFARFIHKVLPDAAIYSFEPLQDVFRELETNTKHIPNIKTFNYGLGEEDTSLTFHRSESSASSSVLPMADLHKSAFPHTAQEVIETIQIRKLDSIAKSLDLTGNTLLKIDVQGYEDRVIRGAMATLEKVNIIVLETSFQTLYQGQPLFDEIYSLMFQNGYKYIGNLGQLKNPSDGSILQADSIFAKF